MNHTVGVYSQRNRLTNCLNNSPSVIAFALPALPVIVVMDCDHPAPALVIQSRPDYYRNATFGLNDPIN